jgi:hypothetical protein
MSTQMPRVEKGIALHDSELIKRSAPGGRLPVQGAKNAPAGGGDRAWTPLHAGSAAAIATANERHDVRHKPALAAQRMRGGK